MKHQSIQTLIGAAAAACAILPAAAQDRERPQVREIEIIEGRDVNPEEMMKRIRERMADAGVDMGELTPEQRERIQNALRRAGGENPWRNAPRAEGPKTDSPWRIGVMAEPVGDLLRTHLDLPKEAGMIVTRVIDGSPAAKAGLEPNDILIAAGDRKISNLDVLREAVAASGKSGRPLKLAVIKKGKRQQVSIEPEGPKPEPKKADQPKRDMPMARPGAEMLERQNRRFEEMSHQLRRMAEQIEKQQRQINELNERLARKQGEEAPRLRPERTRR